MSMTMSDLFIPPSVLCLADYEQAASQRVPASVWAWAQGGSHATRQREAAAFANWSISARVLADCRAGHTRRHLLGHRLHHPILLAPVGYQRLVHADGEAATAAGALDTVMTVSTMASVSVETIAANAAGPLWFQLYCQPRREDTLALIRRAEAAGAKALMVTLDAPVQAAPLDALRAGFTIPDTVRAVHVEGFAPPPKASAQWYNRALAPLCVAAPTWDDAQALRQHTSLPLLAKGVAHPDDAQRLMALGWDGIVLSTHGGRVLDAAPAPLALLPAMRAALGPGPALLLDGSVRSGTDIFKALALGADAVMLGRPQLHALAVAGALGVAHMLKLVREELELAMVLAGCPTLDAITQDALTPC